MKDLFREWWVPRSEYRRMTEYFADEIAELRVRVQELEDQLKIEAVCNLDDFGFVQVVEPPQAPPVYADNVISIDSRRVK